MQKANDGKYIEYGYVDTGDYRDLKYLLFSHQQQLIDVGIGIRGWEMDGRESYQEEFALFDSVYAIVIKQVIANYNEGEVEFEAVVDQNTHRLILEWKNIENTDVGFLLQSILLGLILGGIIKIIYEIVEKIVEIIDSIYGAWAHADLIISYYIVLSALDLLNLTNTAIPLPSPSEYTTRDGIKVKVTPIGKNTNEYREKENIQMMTKVVIMRSC